MGIETDLVAAIRALSAASTPPDASVFKVHYDGQPIQVVYNGGSSSSLTFSVPYDVAVRAGRGPSRGESAYREAPGGLVAIRPMSLELRRERADDIKAKKQGISREFQTGDKDFDRAIYIVTPTKDETVLREVLNPQVRAGVLALFAQGIQTVAIDDDGSVHAQLTGFHSTLPSGTRGPALIAAFAAVANGLPMVRASGGAHPANPWKGRLALGGALAVGGLVLVPFAYFGFAESVACTEHPEDGVTNLKDGCSTPGAIGLVSGALMGVLAARAFISWVSPRLRGESDSHSRIGSLSVVVFALVAETTFVLASGLGLALGIGR